MRKWQIAQGAALAGALAAGCINYARPAGAPKELTPAERNFQAFWQASLETLRRYYFTIDRQDRRAGIIVTQPVTGKQFGEFWRHDAATRFDLAEGTIQTIYRQVKVTIRPVDGAKDRFKASVEVRTYRSNRPEMQITTTSDAHRMFTLPGSPEKQENMLAASRLRLGESVSDPGRDANLERKIAAEINGAAEALVSKT